VGAHDEIKAAMKAYYEAGAKGESRARFFVRADYVTAMHPGGGRLIGWEEVTAPYKEPLSSESPSRTIEIRDLAINVRGDVAWAIFLEHLEEKVPGEPPLVMDIRVSNIYEKHGSEWLIALHHDSLPDAQALNRLQTLRNKAQVGSGEGGV
jgi:ketosteroid isomerase-like protein